MAKPLMSDAEIKHRKKIQGKISQTSSTLGLTAVGALGAGALAAKKPGVLKAINKTPGLKKATPDTLKSKAGNIGVVSSGVAGLGGYNFAAYTNAESRKRTAVKKSYDTEYETPVFGETNE